MAKDKRISPFNALNGIGLEKPLIPFEIKGGSRSDKKMATIAVNHLAENFPEGKKILETAQTAGYSICLRKNYMKENGYVNPAEKSININTKASIYGLEMAIMEHGANAAAIANGKLLTKYSESLIEKPTPQWISPLRPFGALVAEGKAYAAVAMTCMNNDTASQALHNSNPYLFSLMREIKDDQNADQTELLESAISYFFNQKEIKNQCYHMDAFKKNKTAMRMIQSGTEFKVNPDKVRAELAKSRELQSKKAVKPRIHTEIKKPVPTVEKKEAVPAVSKKELNPAILAALRQKTK